MIKTTYTNNFRDNDGSPTYYRSANLKFLNEFIKLNEEKKLRLQKRQQKEYDLKIAALKDDEVFEFQFMK